MLLGQSIFQSVLTRLKEEQKDEDEAPSGGSDYRIHGLGAGFLTPEGRPEAATSDAGSYFDYLADWPAGKPDPAASQGSMPADRENTQQSAEPPVMPAHLMRLKEEEIAQDLAMSQKDTEAILNEKRRQFAKLNHPDLVHPGFRDNATIRMKTANLLIDRAISSLFWRG